MGKDKKAWSQNQNSYAVSILVLMDTWVKTEPTHMKRWQIAVSILVLMDTWVKTPKDMHNM